MCQLVAGVNYSSLNIKIICGVGMGCEKGFEGEDKQLLFEVAEKQ